MDSRPVIWDPLRKRNVALTPEERVRQWFIGVLSQKLGVPMHMMMSEVGFRLGGKQLRADVVVYDRQAQPLVVVECRMNPGLELFGVVLTMFDGRTNFSNQVAQEVRRHFPGKVFANVIPRNVRLAEAPSHGIPVMQYDKYSRGAKAYKELAEEFKAKL